MKLSSCQMMLLLIAGSIVPNTHFYSELARQSGAFQIACLNGELLDTGLLQSRIQAWISGPNAGLLSWLDRRAEVLSHPFDSRPWAKSLLLVVFVPVPDPDNPLFQLPKAVSGRPAARLAAYTLNEDYHRTGLRILDRIIQYLDLSAVELEAGVDAGALLEKSMAVAAGLGCYGYNTLLRTAEWGTQVHLGYLFSARPLPVKIHPSEIHPDCADCRLCLQSCPNQALSSTAGLQLQLCRSFLASEKKGALTWREQQLLGGALAGCSLCSRCCPGTTLLPGEDFSIDAEEFCKMPAFLLERLMKGTVLQHIGVTRLKRNAVAALGTQLPHAQRSAMQQSLLNCSNSENVRKTLYNWPT